MDDDEVDEGLLSSPLEPRVKLELQCQRQEEEEAVGVTSNRDQTSPPSDNPQSPSTEHPDVAAPHTHRTVLPALPLEQTPLRSIHDIPKDELFTPGAS
jgi:hypothetical protein